MEILTSEKIAFGGGCHWCTEAVFQVINGVVDVDQGFVSSFKPYDKFSEAVMVHFDPAVVNPLTLIKIHLETHSSAAAHNLRHKYRSAIYTFTLEQERRAYEMINTMNKELSQKIITKVLPFCKFQPSAEEFRNYYVRDPVKPFCQTYITPKLEFLNARYSHVLKK